MGYHKISSTKFDFWIILIPVLALLLGIGLLYTTISIEDGLAAAWQNFSVACPMALCLTPVALMALSAVVGRLCSGGQREE